MPRPTRPARARWRAIRAALFERHRSTAVEDLRPWGEGGGTAPQVELDFLIDGQSHRLVKSFFGKKRCTPEQRRQKCRTPFGLTKKLLGIHSDMASPAGEANLDLFHLNAAGLP